MANMRRLLGFQFALPFQPLLLIRQHYHDFLVVNRARCDAVEEFPAVTAKDRCERRMDILVVIG